MIKLIASDLDGTLLRNGARSLNPDVFQVIRTLKQLGILFVAASGRQYQNMRRLFEPVKNDIAYICENGTLGVYHDEIFCEENIPRDVGQDILNAIKQTQGCELLLSARTTHYLENPSVKYEHHIRHIVGNDVVTITDIFSVREPILKISACDFNGAAHLDPFFQEHFADRLNIALAGDIWLDAMPQGVHKGYALNKLIGLLGIRPEECVAFGDQYNDMEMLQLVGTSYAMTNAVSGLIETADHLTDDVISTIGKLQKI